MIAFKRLKYAISSDESKMMSAFANQKISPENPVQILMSCGGLTRDVIDQDCSLAAFRVLSKCVVSGGFILFTGHRVPWITADLLEAEGFTVINHIMPGADQALRRVFLIAQKNKSYIFFLCLWRGHLDDFRTRIIRFESFNLVPSLVKM